MEVRMGTPMMVLESERRGRNKKSLWKKLWSIMTMDIRALWRKLFFVKQPGRYGGIRKRCGVGL